LEQVHEAIFTWEFEGGITYWNRGAEEAYGYTRAQAFGHKPYELLATSPPASVFREALVRAGEWSGELVHTRSDGEQIIVDSRMILERGAGRHHLVIETNHVITERKQTEKALRDRADELAAADRSKNEFLAMLAHELRNPLAPLQNALAISRDPGATAEMLERAEVIMSRQIQNMTRIVDDLLDVTRLTRGTIELRLGPVNVARMLVHAVEASQHEIEERGQELSTTPPPADVCVEGDQVRLEQIFANLLNNASKFTPRGGHIWVTAERNAGVDEPGEVVVRVRDNGVGMTPELLPQVFDLFMQAERSPDRTRGGLGIGLTVVRRLVELHRGKVEASSPGPGLGSEFVVRLPIMPGGPLRDSREIPSAEGAMPQVVSRRIMVVDDNPDSAGSMAMVLNLDGHDVQVTHDGASTLSTARTFRPEVVFLDIGMPGMDGYETAMQLRRLPGLETALVVAVTGYSLETNRPRAKEARFDHYLTKPVQFETVRSLIAQSRPST
jgi:two-component system CheB/CheR fusion protein